MKRIAYFIFFLSLVNANEIESVKLSDIEVGEFSLTPDFTTAKTFPNGLIYNVVRILSKGGGCVISGRVLQYNVGSPIEGTPVFFGSAMERPKFVSYTDSTGSFSFSAKSLKMEGLYLYVGGHIEATKTTKLDIYTGSSSYVLAKDSSTARYSLTKLDAEQGADVNIQR